MIRRDELLLFATKSKTARKKRQREKKFKKERDKERKKKGNEEEERVLFYISFSEFGKNIFFDKNK